MVREKLKQLALQREVQILVVFITVASFGYYYYLKNKKKDNV